MCKEQICTLRTKCQDKDLKRCEEIWKVSLKKNTQIKKGWLPTSNKKLGGDEILDEIWPYTRIIFSPFSMRLRSSSLISRLRNLRTFDLGNISLNFYECGRCSLSSKRDKARIS
jgi:hypothetical protein